MVHQLDFSQQILRFPMLKQKRSKVVEIIVGRLYWISDHSMLKNISKSFYFNIDDDLQYQPFYMDFGPLNLGKTWKYVTELEKLLESPQYKKCQIFHYTSVDQQKAANAAYLMGAFQVISLGYSAEKAYEPFKALNLKPFRDASYGQSTYKCTLLDCLRGLSYAIKLGWFNYKKFNLAEYEHYQRVQNGDLNWIIPDKFIAFSSPFDQKEDKHGNRLFTPQDYVPIFKKLGVKMVIRLNNKTYDAEGFIKQGIKHNDLFFTDGTAPPPEIVDEFLRIVEKEEGVVAVHCKAGLGRTGTLIACYAMKHYNFPAADFIGWIRIARPGSILGPQQQFLIEQQPKMRERGKTSKIWRAIEEQIDEKQTVYRLKSVSLIEGMNKRQLDVLKNGDNGQGENLVQAKLRRDLQRKIQQNDKRSRTKVGSSNPKYSPKGKFVAELHYRK